MVMDAKLVFCKAADAKTAVTGTAIDFLQKAPTTGMNDTPLYCVVKCPTALVGTSIKVDLEDSDDNSAFAACLSTGAVTAADANKGFAIPLPLKHKRYLRMKMTPTSITAGTLTAFLSDSVEMVNTYKVEGIEFLPDAAPAAA